RNTPPSPAGGGPFRLELTLPARDHESPAFLQIANAISEAVAQGRLLPGQRLPSSRALASQLGVHRNAVLASYRELLAQDWIRCEQGRGTFVSESLPLPVPAALNARRARQAPGFELRGPPPAGVPDMPHGSGVTYLYGGLPD